MNIAWISVCFNQPVGRVTLNEESGSVRMDHFLIFTTFPEKEKLTMALKSQSRVFKNDEKASVCLTVGLDGVFPAFPDQPAFSRVSGGNAPTQNIPIRGPSF